MTEDEMKPRFESARNTKSPVEATFTGERDPDMEALLNLARLRKSLLEFSAVGQDDTGEESEKEIEFLSPDELFAEIKALLARVQGHAAELVHTLTKADKTVQRLLEDSDLRKQIAKMLIQGLYLYNIARYIHDRHGAKVQTALGRVLKSREEIEKFVRENRPETTDEEILSIRVKKVRK